MNNSKLMMAVATAHCRRHSTVFAQQQGGAPGGVPAGQMAPKSSGGGQTTTGQPAAPGGVHNGPADIKGGKNAAEERGEQSKPNRAGDAQPNRRETTGHAAPQNERTQQNERKESQSNERRENKAEGNKAEGNKATNGATEERRLDQNRATEERRLDQNRATEERGANDRNRTTESAAMFVTTIGTGLPPVRAPRAAAPPQLSPPRSALISTRSWSRSAVLRGLTASISASRSAPPCRDQSASFRFRAPSW